MTRAPLRKVLRGAPARGSSFLYWEGLDSAECIPETEHQGWHRARIRFSAVGSGRVEARFADSPVGELVLLSSL